LVAEVHGIIRGASNDKAGAKTKAHEAEVVPASARLLEEWSLARDAGLTFALLTGDVNPLHWLAPYARLMGFRGTILHGFAAMARAFVGIERAFAPRRLRLLDVRFVRPVLLPARVSLYVEGERLFVGTTGAAPYLTGSFATA
jgi:acyl dehydratase